MARNFITGKVYNCRWVLERAVRDYSLRIDTDSIKKKSKILYQSLEKIRTCKTRAQLLGLEGEEAAVYFSGQKSAEDVAKIIQSRMQVYLSETK